MTQSLEASLASLTRLGLAPSVIAQSWERCLSFGLATAQVQVPFVGERERERRVRDAAALLQSADPHLRWISAAVARLPFHCVMLTDADGVIVASTGSDPVVLDRFGLRAGYEWSEQAMGTNGIGTAIAAGVPVAVVGEEHYLEIIQPYTCVGAPILGPDGRVVGALDLCTNASDGDPERLVLVAYAANAIARELSRDEDRRVRDVELLSMAAHDLSTPLTTLRLLSHTLLSHGERDPALRELVVRLDEQVRRLTRTTRAVLDVSGRGAGPEEPLLEPEPIDALVREVAEEFVPDLARRQRRLELRSIGEPVGCRRPSQLQQIVANFLSNAVKYGEGTVEIGIRARDGRVRIGVTDHGPGLSPEQRERVFQRFWRADSARRMPGDGLGLWIVQRLVESMGGELGVESEPGRGATFWFEVPAVPMPEQPPAPPSVDGTGG